MRLSSRPARRPRRARARALARALALAPLPLLAPLGAARAQAPVCEPPNTLLLLDRSGSMLEGDKWGQALRALSGAFAPNLDRVRLGVLAFPWRRGEEQACGVPAEGLRVPLGEATPERLVALGADALPVDEALTPLAAAIDQGRAQLMALDDGRKKVLVLLTDGVETCADGGQPGSTAPQEAARGAAEDDIDVYAIGLGSLVSRATLRAVAEVGGTGRERLATDEESLRATLEEIIDGANVEVCDGFDNDCDGRVDEGTEGVCASGCHEGVLLCQEGELSVCTAPAVSAERCNQVDDDCDGRVDELNPCAAGATCGDGRCLLPCPPDGCPGGGMCGEDGYCEGGALDAPGGSGAPAGGAPGGAGESEGASGGDVGSYQPPYAPPPAAGSAAPSGAAPAASGAGCAQPAGGAPWAPLWLLGALGALAAGAGGRGRRRGA